MYKKLRIEQHDDKYITISMNDNFAAIKSIDLPRECRKEPNQKCTEKELCELRRLARELNYLGYGIFPPDFHAESELLQRSFSLTFAKIAFDNKCLRPL